MAKAVGTGPSRELTLGRGLNCEDGRGGQSGQEMAGAKVQIWNQHEGQRGGNESQCLALESATGPPNAVYFPVMEMSGWAFQSRRLSSVLAARAPSVLFCRDWLLFFVV